MGNDDRIVPEFNAGILRYEVNNRLPGSVLPPCLAASLGCRRCSQFAHVSLGGEDSLPDVVSFAAKDRRLLSKPGRRGGPSLVLLGGIRDPCVRLVSDASAKARLTGGKERP